MMRTPAFSTFPTTLYHFIPSNQITGFGEDRLTNFAALPLHLTV